MVRAAWMEKIMTNSNDTSRLATFEDHDALADSELDAVNGGLVVIAIIAVCISLLLPAVQSAREAG
jgi:hypothetical protein